MAELDWVRAQAREASRDAVEASRTALRWALRLWGLEREVRRFRSLGEPDFAPSTTHFAQLPLAWQLPARLVANEQPCQGDPLLQMQLDRVVPICAINPGGELALPLAETPQNQRVTRPANGVTPVRAVPVLAPIGPGGRTTCCCEVWATSHEGDPCQHEDCPSLRRLRWR
jgi:hypothetical protein